MTIRLRRTLARLTAFVVGLAVLTLPAAAEPARRELTLTLEVREEATLSRDSATPAFWEWPALSAGQTLTGGTLTLRNTSAYTVRFSLDRVTMPYDDPEVLDYLNAVTLTLRRGDQVLFSDRFVRLADFSCDLGTFGTDEEVTIRRRCVRRWIGTFRPKPREPGKISSPTAGDRFWRSGSRAERR